MTDQVAWLAPAHPRVTISLSAEKIAEGKIYLYILQSMCNVRSLCVTIDHALINACEI